MAQHEPATKQYYICLYVRGRHHMISAITVTGTFNKIHSRIRVKSTELYICRLRNQTILNNLQMMVQPLLVIVQYYTRSIQQHTHLIILYML